MRARTYGLVASITLALFTLTAGEAAAAEPNTEKPAAPTSKTLQPFEVDAKLTGNSDTLLAFMGVGAVADVGVAKAGPGTISLGAAGEYDFCGSACWAASALTGLEFGQSQVSLWGRASYHIAMKGKSVEKLDVYPFVMAGPAFARSYVRMDDGSAEYRGKDTAFAVGAGVGVNLFVAGPFFIGGEARIRWAQGTYDYELVTGDGRTVLAGREVNRWSTSGVDLVFAMGVRF